MFNKAIDNTEKVEDLAVRLKILLDEITLAVYANVSRGLFERHKLVFSFMLCTSIFKQAGIINERQWNFLLRRPSVGMVSHCEIMSSVCAFFKLVIKFSCFYHRFPFMRVFCPSIDPLKPKLVLIMFKN